MSRSRRAPWVKLYTDFTSTPSHDALDGDALWVGVVLMLLVRASNDIRNTRDPWALMESGAAFDEVAISRRARKTVQVVRRSMALLMEAGTVIRNDDGAYGIPKFWDYQETPDAARKRIGKSTESPPEVREDSRQEERGKREEKVPSPNGDSSKTPDGPAVSDRAESLTAKARRLWDAHEAMRVRHGIGRHRGFNPTARGMGTPAILALVAHVRKREDCDEETAIGHVLAKLERGCRDCAAGRIGRNWVNGPTAWRTSSYDAATDSEQRSAPKPDLREQYAANLERARREARDA